MNKHLNQLNYEFFKYISLPIVFISISMLVISFLINDVITVIILNFTLLCASLYQYMTFTHKPITNYKKSNKKITFFLLAWSILRVSVTPENIFAHITFLVILLSYAFFINFDKNTIIKFYSGIYFFLAIAFILSLEENTILYLVVYMNIMIFLIVITHYVNRYKYNIRKNNLSLKLSEKRLSDFLTYEKKEKISLGNQFESVINFATDVMTNGNQSEEKFLKEMLEYLYDNISESDAASVFIYSNDYIVFVDVINYNKEEILNQILYLDNIKFIDETVAIVDDGYDSIRRADVSTKLEKILNQYFNTITRSMIFSVKITDSTYIGVSLDIHGSNTFSHNSLRVMKGFKNIVSSFYMDRKYNRLKSKHMDNIVYSFIKFLEAHDTYTQGHSVNVSKYAVEVADALSLSNEEVKDIYWAAMLHDIGKLIIPNDILNKKGALSDEEYMIIKKHPEIGSHVFDNGMDLKNISLYIRHHHERFDGKGYPDKLAGDQIPLASRIITVVDAYDAMTSERSYRSSLSESEAIEQLKINADIQFDKKIVDVFIKQVLKK